MEKNVTFFSRLERVKCNFQVRFLTNSRSKNRILEDSFERFRKNYTVEKKNSCKKLVKTKSYDHFPEFIFQKKNGKFSKKKFLKVLFHF